ncbi:unnamed protein product [Linum trigynum]|uniref:Uncharacterized protein n=1 Tax=Linum trigynum TaxID=586398 RepID=A0AAV2DXZ6_9ROSI
MAFSRQIPLPFDALEPSDEQAAAARQSLPAADAPPASNAPSGSRAPTEGQAAAAPNAPTKFSLTAMRLRFGHYAPLFPA